MTGRDAYPLAKKAVDFALTKKALDVCILDLRTVTSVADYFVICHGESDTQVKAIAEAVLDGLRKEGWKVWHAEGLEYLNWALLDYVDVVVHIFQKETRSFYNLERLWGDTEIQRFET